MLIKEHTSFLIFLSKVNRLLLKKCASSLLVIEPDLKMKPPNIEAFILCTLTMSCLFSHGYEEYLAAAYLKRVCLKHGAAQELLSEEDIDTFLKRTNVRNFVVGASNPFLPF